MNIIEAINDKNLFRPFLADKNDCLDSWNGWQAALKAIHGIAIRNPSQYRLVKQITGRTALREGIGFQTSLLLTGRRSGKSRMAAILGMYEAVLAGHEKKLAPGETGLVLVVAPTRAQARIVKDYKRAIIDGTPLLKQMVIRETKNGFELSNGIRIEILSGDFRSVRGFTLVAAIVDEICFFGYGDDDKIKSDTELVRALQPALATTRGKLIAISSPYAMKGWAYAQFKKHHANDRSRTLVLNCGSRILNPTLPQSVIDEAMEEDPAAARAEYMGLFRDDIVTFISREVVEALVVKGRQQLSPQPNIVYSGFVDISGGRSDDAALAIAHKAGRKVVVDAIYRYEAPFSPDQVISQMCDELAKYRISRVFGDAYAAEFTKQSFEVRGFKYGKHTHDTFAKNPIRSRVAKPKSELYLELLPRLCSGEIELLDHEILVNQLCNLERRTRSGGRDIIDHPPGMHDDVANVVAGVCEATLNERITLRPMMGAGARGDVESHAKAFAARQLEYAKENAFLNKKQTRSEEFVEAVSMGRASIVG